MSLQIVICERFVAGFDYKSSDLISTVATLQNQKWLIVEVPTPFLAHLLQIFCEVLTNIFVILCWIFLCSS